jgi:hypothetical protein
MTDCSLLAAACQKVDQDALEQGIDLQERVRSEKGSGAWK